MSVAGVQVTSPLRTALDLGRLLRRHEAIGAIDALMRCCAITRRDLEGHLPRFRGARGVIQLRQLVAIGDPRAESPAESLVRLRLWDASLPVPELQWTVIHEPTGSMYRLDLAYPDIMLGIEYDGADDHTSSSDIEHDAVRRRRLEDMGWTIVVLRSADVYGPDATMTRTVRDAIALAVATR